MIDLLYDCDLTMGLPNRDVDDGLALAFLLGHPEIRLLGVTSTFGNAGIDEVHPCLERALEALGAGDTPCRRGASSPASRSSPAAVFLAETAAHLAAQGSSRVRVLATGALSNLYAAGLHDPEFFEHLSEIVLMGGITEPLHIGGRIMGELNLACDPEAAFGVLHSGARLTVISGNLCLQGFWEREGFLRSLDALAPGLRRLLRESVEPWLNWYRREYGLEGFHPWDAIAAACLTDPGLLERRERVLLSEVEDLRTGLLRTAAPASRRTHRETVFNLPSRLRDPEALHRRLSEAWQRLGRRLADQR